MKKLLTAVLFLATGAAAQGKTLHPGAGPGDRVLIGQSAALADGESVRDLVVIGGSADVSGAVEHDLVVVGGSAKLGPKASVGHDAVVIGGGLDLAPGATIGHERTVIGIPGAGSLAAPAIGAASGFAAQSLLRGRPLAPRFWWSWALGLGFLVLYILIAAGAPAAVEASADALAARPVGAFLAGALGLAGLAPFSFLMVVSVVGIAVVPLFLLAAFAALAVGKAGLCRLVGRRLGLAAIVPATAAGAAALLLLYSLPFFGGLVWALAVVFGFGAALLAGVEQLQRERPAAATATATAAVEPAPVPPAASAPGVPASSLPRAGFWLRAGALVIDCFAWAVIGGITHLHLLGLGGWALYQIGMWVWKGTTLGGMIVGIKGARADGRPMDVTVALVRHLASYLSALPMGLGFFWAGFDPEKQTWHDKIAGTIVVRVPHGQALL